MSRRLEHHEIRTWDMVRKVLGIFPCDECILAACDHQRRAINLRKPIVSVVVQGGLKPVIECDRIDRPLTARLNHCRNDFRMSIYVSFGEGGFGERAAAVLG